MRKGRPQISTARLQKLLSFILNKYSVMCLAYGQNM